MIRILKKKRKNPNIILFHGTSEHYGNLLLKNGWQPNKIKPGANQGQSKYLYLTSEPLDALWFAEQINENTILKVLIPNMNYLSIDPEDSIGNSIEEELEISKKLGTPTKFVLVKELSKNHFSKFKLV